jgi:hypothetical protein
VLDRTEEYARNLPNAYCIERTTTEVSFKIREPVYDLYGTDCFDLEEMNRIRDMLKHDMCLLDPGNITCKTKGFVPYGKE